MTDPKEQNAASLGDMNDFQADGDGGQAKVKQRKSKVKEQAWKSDDSAGNLLAGLLGEAEIEAEAEKLAKEAERKNRDAIAEAKKREEEERKRREADEKLRAEQNRLAQVEVRRTQMLAAIERQKKIETGEIDVEEEERKRREELEKKRREEEEKAAKEAELHRAKEEAKRRDLEIQRLKDQQLEIAAMQPKSNTGLIIGLAAGVLLIGGVVVFLLVGREPPAEPPNPYALAEKYTSTQISVSMPESDMLDVGLDVVSQSAGQAVTQIESTATGSSGKSSGRKGDSKKKDNFNKALDNSAGSDVLTGKGKVVF